MKPQSTFMICATVREGKLESLCDLLRSMNISHKKNGLVNPDNSLIPFSRFPNLHVARFVIIEATTADDIKAFGLEPKPWSPTLALLGDIDGDRNDFFDQLVELAEQGLTQIFSFCIGFPDANSNTLKHWLQTHDVEPDANYINWLGRTVKQIHEEAALHQCLAEHLPQSVDEVRHNTTSPLSLQQQLRQSLLSYVEMQKQTGRLILTPPECTPCRWQLRNLLHKIGIPLVLLLLLPLFLLITPSFLLRIRMLEQSDPELFIRPSREHIKQLSAQEDWYVTNQFNVFGYVKPGLIRLLTFKFILLLTNYIARHIYNHGFLTRIKTIHFARWVFLDDNQRVYFASNYDGSHESYMDDFINKVGWGLNLAFSNGIGYPRTRWLIKEGATREHQFKYSQRRHQFPSEVWYKAYPDLTATDLARNHRIRLGLEIRQSSDADISEWLSLI
ncbi:MAG: hypothetical protein RIQ94_1626 [Pseudomonadota bacterium]